MRKTITISVSERMHEFIVEQSRFTTVSEYIRSLISRDHQERSKRERHPAPTLRQANEYMRNIAAGDDT